MPEHARRSSVVHAPSSGGAGNGAASRRRAFVVGVGAVSIAPWLARRASARVPVADAREADGWQPSPAVLPGARRMGQGTLRVWGLAIYDASLWVGPGFRADRWATFPFALSLRYRRDFRGVDIARRSLDEMQRMQPIDDAAARRWLAAMQRAFPDVSAGDRLTGVWLPAASAPSGDAFDELDGRVQFQGPTTTVTIDGEPGFGPRFFGLWLSPRGPKLDLRASLLGEGGSS